MASFEPPAESTIGLIVFMSIFVSQIIFLSSFVVEHFVFSTVLVSAITVNQSLSHFLG